MTKILVTRRWPAEVEAYLSQHYETTLSGDDQPLSQDQLRDALRRYDILCTTITDRIDTAVLGGGGLTARLLCNYGVGVNHIDLDAARRAGVAVSNTPDILTESTAELAVALMLMIGRRAGEGERELRAGRWTGWRPSHMQGAQVSGRTLGLVGFGRIGQATARKAHAGLDMPILYHARRRAAPEVEAITGAAFRPSLDDLLAEADFVSLHCPGGAATDRLIDAPALARMKPTAFVINTARGSVVDEAALISALTSGTIAGAGLDVYENEPAVPAELAALENVVLLPHLGSAVRETRVAMGMRAVENLERFLAGQALRDPV